jgi:hypothetical protein
VILAALPLALAAPLGNTTDSISLQLRSVEDGRSATGKAYQTNTISKDCSSNVLITGTYTNGKAFAACAVGDSKRYVSGFLLSGFPGCHAPGGSRRPDAPAGYPDYYCFLNNGIVQGWDGQLGKPKVPVNDIEIVDAPVAKGYVIGKALYDLVLTKEDRKFLYSLLYLGMRNGEPTFLCSANIENEGYRAGMWWGGCCNVEWGTDTYCVEDSGQRLYFKLLAGIADA